MNDKLPTYDVNSPTSTPTRPRRKGRAMTDLREQIGNAVHDARHDMAIDETTDRILALIAEAMLSDVAVMTMLAAMGMGDGRIVTGRAAINAQLAAAGVTVSGQEGGDEVFNCPNCEGTGLYDDCTCSVCEGEGELTQRQWDGN